MSRLDFHIGVFAVNEAATIEACITSIDRACAGHAAHISVLLNGTTDQSVTRLKALALRNAGLTVYLFPVADKANAINHFLSELRRDAAVHVGIDAYTTIGGGSFGAIAGALREHPQALIASALPVSGRSARQIAVATMKGGMANGQFYAMRAEFIDRLARAGLRLPLQLYRVDGLLGSMAAHDLDAIGQPWSNDRIIGVAEATFALTPLSPVKWRDMQRQYKREIRQARGRMENEAIKSIIYRHGYAALPENANDMIRDWLRSDTPSPQSLREQYFTRLALRQLNASANIKAAAPQVVFSSAPTRRAG